LFIPLLELAVDTIVNSDLERYQSGEAASFVDFLLYSYGMPVLRMLYLADSPIELVVPGQLMITVDSLQTEWLTYINQVLRGEIPPRKEMPWSTGKPKSDSANK